MQPQTLRSISSLILGLAAALTLAVPVPNAITINTLSKRADCSTSASSTGGTVGQTCNDNGNGPVITNTGDAAQTNGSSTTTTSGTQPGALPVGGGTTTTNTETTTSTGGEWPMIPDCFSVSFGDLSQCVRDKIAVLNSQIFGGGMDAQAEAEVRAKGWPMVPNCSAKRVTDLGGDALGRCIAAAAAAGQQGVSARIGGAASV